jgi:hypothetical protein
VSTPRKPDLDHLVAALIADIRAEERSGRDAALAAFRAASARDAAHRPAWRHRYMPVFRPLTGLSARLAAVGAALVVIVAGVAAAAYTQALPAPVQNIAHTAFAPLGVPGNQGSPGTAPSSITVATSGGKSSSGTPRPGDDYRITVSASRARVPADGRVAFTGRVTDNGRAAPRTRVRLYERLAGSTRFELEATGVTGPRGGFRLLSPPLTATTVFRVVGPDAVRSAAVRITVTRAAALP